MAAKQTRFHKMMVYLTGVDGPAERERQREEISVAANTNAIVHDYARQVLRRGNSALSDLVQYLNKSEVNHDLPPSSA